ncbi:MAG: endonuclease/exonuclease/phosphatase family protein [Mesorhizobium sp.]
MSLRLATFNVENLMSRFDFSGFRNDLWKDRTLALYEIKNEAEYQALERARAIAHTDDMRQLSALAIAETRADIVVMQEVDNLEALKAFEYGYLFKMIGEGYRNKYSSTGNDSRGIDVAVMMRAETAHGQPIEFVRMTSHAQVTFDEMDLWDERLSTVGIKPNERIFRRDCLEIDVRIAGQPLTIYGVHFKSMGSPRNGMDGRQSTMPLRLAEAKAVRRIIEERFGKDHAGEKRWVICGDFNDYGERVLVGGDKWSGYTFTQHVEEESALHVFTRDGFALNAVERRPELDRWTLFHSRGPQERHLCQLDYILLSPHLARTNADSIPDIVRNGQPWRTPFPPGQEVEHFPRIGWDRPKASDHCPVAITLDLI